MVFNLFEVFQKGRVGRNASLGNQENQTAAKERRSSNDQGKPESFHVHSALVLVCSSEPTSKLAMEIEPKLWTRTAI
jgi:hypothetical protein